MASNHTPCDDGVCGADGEQGRATLIWQQPMCSPFVQQMPGGNVVVNDSVNVASQLSGDILYNGGAGLHPSVPSNVCYSAGHSETYSVLPVGHGNFLKVYHCTDTDSHLQQTQHQQQLMHQHQSVHQQISPTFNSYELFSSNTIVPPPQQKTLMPHSHIGNPEQSSVVFVESSGIQCGPETFNNSELFCTNNIVSPNDANSPSTSTNMIINKLVNNWSPNLTGGAYSQFGNGVMEQQMYATITPIQSNAQHHQPSQEPSFQNSISMRMQMDSNSTIITSIAPPVLVNSQPAVSVETSVESQIKQKQQTHQQLLQQHQSHLQQNTFQSAGTCVSTNGSFENRSSSSTSATILPETVTKKRIVAEVKPMRMTYSDVLSKFNNQQATIATSGSNAKNKSVSKSIKQHQQQQNTLSDRKIAVNNDDGRNSVINKRQDQTGHRQSITDESQMHNAFSKSGGDLKKKSPAHENKENIQQQHTALNCNKSTRKNVTISNGTQKSSSISKNSKHNGVNTNGGVSENRKRSQKRDFDSGLGGGETMKTQKANAYTNSPTVGGGLKEDKDSYYNVTAAKSGSNFERSSKTPSSSTPNNNGNGNHQAQSNNVNNKKTSNSRQPSSGMPSNSFKAYVSQRQQSYSYSSKRGGGQSHQQYHHRNPKYSNKYELAHKFLEYTIKILTWLFYLIYDIVVLGFSVGYERLSHYYSSAYAYAILLRNDLKNNSNKPSIWLKNYLRRIDARFKKTSKWAFWRRFYKKKPVEQAPEYVKTGRLPQTGDEAMYSLLNCKGKDAYSILGVPVDSSQEQIRKHYKKIAVLVHPDKNKQPGAEEAFKVLQRAFELIGEPENRQAYDQSLVEALNAEKAWSELHDLLSQLQSKITEAANTIRCSSCSLRHPRKMTDRPHYAARECASCKIRHSAREGDIWAETTLFGLRWKYLALMEGKVYDITEWANCQKGALSHLEPNSHIVQYRIVRGAQQQQQQQQQQNQQQQQQQQQQQHQPNSQQDKGRFKRGEPRRCEASLDEFLDNLYSGQNRHGQQNAGAGTGSRRRSRRN